MQDILNLQNLKSYATLTVSQDKVNNFFVVSGAEAAAKLKGYVLFHPNPVRTPRTFWNRIKEAKTGKERIQAAKEFELLKEKNIFLIERFVIDVDSPFTCVYPVWRKLQKEIPSLSGDVYITKSGRFRAVVNLRYPLVPERRVGNSTNYRNVREVVERIGEFFEKHRLNFDRTCLRLNHPIWVGRGEELVLEGEKVNFYKLYSEVKKKKIKKKQKSRKGRVRNSFLAWKIFTYCLSRKYDRRRFTNVILPAVKTAQVLGIDREIVEERLSSLFSTRDPEKNRKDFEKAFRYGKPGYIPFPDREKKLSEVVQTVAEKKEVSRQEVIKICYNQKWLADDILKELTSKKLLKMEKRKLKKGRGRKSHIYSFTIHPEEYSRIISRHPHRELLAKLKNFSEKKPNNYSYHPENSKNSSKNIYTDYIQRDSSFNIERNLACIGVFDIDWKRKDSKLERIHFINGELLRLVKKRDYLLELVRIKQKLTGRSPTREDNKRLWRKINNLNKGIALKTAREIAKVVREYEDAIVVFEKLKGLRGEKKKKSKKLNRKLNFWLRKKTTDRVKELSVEEGFSVDFVYPRRTSKRCSLCGAKGERFSPSGSTALFRCPSCGYTVNADVNAVFNQHFLYLPHLLNGVGKRDSVVSPEISLKSSRKRTQSKESLKSNSYVC